MSIADGFEFRIGQLIADCIPSLIGIVILIIGLIVIWIATKDK